MPEYREIVTKAIIGKGRKAFKATYIITPDQKPTTVLGCWVINHTYSAVQKDEHCVINGRFDVNCWYSYDSDSKTNVITKTVEYEDEIKIVLSSDESFGSNRDIIVRTLIQPNVVNARVEGETIELDIEKEFGCELVGETKMRVSVEKLVEVWPSYDGIDSINTDFLK